MSPINLGISPMLMVLGYGAAIILFVVSHMLVHSKKKGASTTEITREDGSHKFFRLMKERDAVFTRKMREKIKKAGIEDEFK